MLRGFIVVLVIGLGVITIPDGFFNTTQKSNAEYITITEQIPQIQDEIKVIQIPEAKPKKLPPAVTIAAQFFSQAPDNKRVLPRAQACSEANIVLAAYYIKGKELTKDQFKKDIIALTKLQTKAFGTYIEVPLAQIKSIYDTYYPDTGKSWILENPSIEDIKKELSQGRLIIAPTAGHLLENPHFFDKGPRFHTILIRGYDDTYFYTNEVGMMKGENFKYKQDTIINAIHDLVDGDITQGAKRILVISK